ncbi:MAG: methyltransferase domain-containing protein [Chitinivibrionales bacterium]|nr:methyltransferase domain-containing protein [Chitinivibrionales bacterium]
MKYFDKQNDRLVYIQQNADKAFWQDHWRKQDYSFLNTRNIPRNNFIIETTKKYLPVNSLLLEGGCGTAKQSWYLRCTGFKVIAMDYISSLPEKIKEFGKEVRYTVADTRHIPLPEHSIDGYWSLGVIEHWYGGYEQFVNEMARVIKPGGYLFLTFPWVNSIRRLKIILKKYPLFTHEEQGIKQFYQFALEKNDVAHKLTRKGFELVKQAPYDGLKGIREDVPPLKGIVTMISGSKRQLIRILSMAINRVACPLAGHMILLVLKKK